MSFRDFDGKSEVRFGGSKFVPDPGKYEVEIQDNIEVRFNENSGKTSLIMDFKTIGVRSGQDPNNIGINVRVYFSDGIPVAVRKLKAVIYSVGKVQYFDEKYEDVPAIGSEEWPFFFKDWLDQLSFRKLEIEINHTAGTGNNKVFANIIAFGPLSPQVKTPVIIDEDFKWAE